MTEPYLIGWHNKMVWIYFISEKTDEKLLMKSSEELSGQDCI